MKYCTHCGKELANEAVVCTGCGCAVNGAKQVGTAVAGDDVPSLGLNVLSFFIPIVGLILFCTMHSNTPCKAKQIGIWALIGFILNFIILLAL